MTYSLRSRALALSAATATLALALVAAPTVFDDSAIADNPTCLPGYFDVGNLINPPHQETDPDVGTYVAGNLNIATGASEMEGTFVIGEDATFNSGAYFNVGTVGAGSQYVPAYGSDMLTVGGDLTIPSAFNVEVGNLAGPLGGNVVVGGSVSVPDQAQLTFNGGTLTQGGGVAVIAPYAPVAALYSGLSTEFSALADTGTVSNDSGNVYFTSTNTDVRQVFTVAGTVLGSLGSTKTMNFINIPTDAVVIINVTGTAAVLSANAFVLNGTTINPSAAEPNRVFSHFTQSLLWNFATATSVTLGQQDQLLGSILVPTAGSSTQLLTSTNGRLYINGDLTLGGGTFESGLEIHNYPFRSCSAPGTGSLSIAKSIDDVDAVVDTARTYDVDYSCVDSAATVVASGSVSLTAGAAATVITGIPVDAECSIVEDPATLTAEPTADDSSYVWDTETYSPSSVTITDGGTGALTVTNHVERLTGSISISKALTDPDDVVTTGRVFDGTYNCENAGGVSVASGTWAVAAGAAADVHSGIPLGATCTFTEDLSDAPSTDPTYGWAAPVYSPSNSVVTVGGGVSITVTNEVVQGVGAFTIGKTVIDPDDVVPSGRTFSGTWTCEDGGGATVASGTWTLAHGATATQSGIPLGSICSVLETAPADPSASDSSYFWAPVSYSAASVTINVTTTPALTVTNEVQRSTGSLAITKTLTDPDTVVTTGRTFTGTYTCVDSVGDTIASGSWSVTTTTTDTISGLPADAECSFTENLSAAPSATDASYVWQAAVFSPASVTIADGTTVSTEVQNTVRQGLGDLQMLKILDDPFDVVDLARVYTGTWSCSFNAAVIESGTWSTTAGAAPLTLATDLPMGTVCVLAEDASTLAAPPLAGFPQYIWRAPSISPTTVTIADGVTHTFTVTNTVYDPFDVLAATGTDAAMPLLIGGSAVTGGLLAVLLGYRRRRSA